MNTTLDYPDCSIPNLLQQCVRTFATHRAIVFGDRVLDFAAVGDLSDRVAAGLHARGICKGDRVALYCMNSDVFAIAYIGIVKAGATVVPVNILLNPKEIAYILRDAGVKGLIYHEAFAAAVQSLREDIDTLELRVRIGKTSGSTNELPWEELLVSNASPPEIEIDAAEDAVVILYTSGTTGHPKGAMLTHRNLISNTFSIKAALHLEPGIDTLLVVLPMFHAFAATVGMLFPLLHGCTIVTLPRFDPEQVADTIAASRATIFLGVPSMFQVLLRLRDAYVSKLSSLKFAVSGGAAMPVEVMKQFETRFGTLIYEGDGPTECSPVTCVNPIEGLRKPGSVGLPVPGVQMKIVDEAGAVLPGGQIGEICVKGPNVMKGYWRQPEATRASFFGDWFRTGDLGTKDEDGYFSIVDRKKDMIIVNGMNVYPRVIEEVLYQHPAVHEAAVVGQPHRLHGEIPVVYIARKPDHDLSAAEVTAFCRDNLGRHEVPRKVNFLPELPKNPTGKILKRQLRRQGEYERGIDIQEIQTRTQTRNRQKTEDGNVR